MQPEKRRARLQSAALARGKMFFKSDLGWLPGFPCGAEAEGVVWMVVPRGGERGVQPVVLDREALRRATYTRSKLIRRFPRVLRRLVEDPDWWPEGTANILEWLKGAIHHGRRLPVSLLGEQSAFSPHAIKVGKELVAKQPALRPVIDALSWLTYLAPEDFAAGVKWCRSNARALEVLCTMAEAADRGVDALVIWELGRRVGERAAQPLVDWLGDRRAYTCATSAGSFCRQWAIIRRKAEEQRRKLVDDAGEALAGLSPPTSARDSLRGFARWLLEQDRPTARRALELLGLVFPADLYDRWESWWGQLAGHRRTIAALRAASAESAAKAIQALFDDLGRALPQFFRAEDTLDAIRAASAPVRRSLYSAMRPCLEALPMERDGRHLRALFMMHWLRLHEVHEGKVPPYLRELRRYQRTAVEPERLYSLWWDLLDSWDPNVALYCDGPDYRLLFGAARPVEWRRALETLARFVAASTERIGGREMEWALALARFSGSAQEAYDRYAAILRQVAEPPFPINDLVELAVRLSESADDLAALYLVLEKTGAFIGSDHARILDLQRDLEGAGWPGLLRGVIGDRQPRGAMSVVKLRALCKAMARPVPPPPAPSEPAVPAWASGYPAAVRKSLAVLDAVCPDGQSAARRLLKSLFFDDDRMDAEIQAIEKRLAARPDDDRLRRRLERLRERRTAPPTPRPKQVRKAVERIERLTRRAVLDTWQELLMEQLRAALPTCLDTDGDVSILYEPRHLAAFGAAMTLAGPSKTLALELYRRRCGPPPWDLRVHPANVVFVQRMRARGLDLSPWLEHREVEVWKAPSGAQLTIGFEEDPLEIFQMGAYFNTCLSPGDFNFFSVFANAADINKRVLMARDARGRVVGRCLFAISDAGGLLTFHPYCHEGDLRFAERVKETASRLAREMGTAAVPRGSVATLVATEWYDDGPVDLCGRFPCLEDGSELRKALEAAPLTDVRRLLVDAFDPVPLSALTLGMLLELPEVEARPEIVLPLLADLEDAEGLTTAQWSRVVESSVAAGAPGFAARLVRQRLVPAVLADHRRNAWVSERTLEVIARIDPSTAIRVVRMTRPQHVRRDADEEDGRKHVLAMALRQLGRPKRAEKLLPGGRERREG